MHIFSRQQAETEAAPHYSLLQQPLRRQTHTQMQQMKRSITKPEAPAIKVVIFKGSAGREQGQRDQLRVYATSQCREVALKLLTVDNFELLGHTALRCPHTVGGLTAIHPFICFGHTL